MINVYLKKKRYDAATESLIPLREVLGPILAKVMTGKGIPMNLKDDVFRALDSMDYHFNIIRKAYIGWYLVMVRSWKYE